MYFDNNRDKYRGIAFGYSSNVILYNTSDCGSKLVLALKKPAFLGESVKTVFYIVLQICYQICF